MFAWPWAASCPIVNSVSRPPRRTIGAVKTATLGEFIGVHREELLRRCRAKVASRSGPQPAPAGVDPGLPRFLDDIVVELGGGPSQTREMDVSATEHGARLFFQGFTVSQVVHGYGDICQAITGLAVELTATITATEFRTLNRCLDDAIARAVVEHGRQQRVASGDSLHQSMTLRNLIGTALTGFEAIQTGTVAVGGTTALLVHRSLLAIRDLSMTPAEHGSSV